jgi:hypothetical protein
MVVRSYIGPLRLGDLLSLIVVGLISYFFARVVQDGQRGRDLWRLREMHGQSAPANLK